MTGGLSSGPSTASHVLDAELLDYIGAIFTSHGIPGLSLAIVHAKLPAEYANWGVRNEDGDAMTSDTLVTIASCSKAFLTTAMGILLDDFASGNKALPAGLTRVDWDTPAAKLLPGGEWKLHPEYGVMSERMTLRDMLSHRTGLHRHLLSYGEPGDTVADVVRRLRYQRPAFEPRARYLYCNPMYIAAHRILDVQTGSFTDFVENRIFKPLGMDSMYSPDAELATGRAAFGFTNKSKRALPFFFDQDNYQLSAGPGGVVASAEGLTKWVQMLLHDGINPETGETVIPKNVFKETTTAQVIVDGMGTAEKSIRGYGLGWVRGSYHGHEIIYHTGANNDVTTLVMFAPHDRVGLVVLINQYLQMTFVDIGWAILRKTFGVPLGEPPKPPSSTLPEVKYETVQAAKDRQPPPVGLAGTYHSLGQGSPITLYSSSSTGPEAESVLSVFRTISGDLSPDELYAAFPRAWCTHVRLVHLEGARFSLRYNWLFPQGHGKDTSPFAMHAEDQEVGDVTFVVEEEEVIGFGLTGTADGETVLERRGGTVKDTADAWFDRLTGNSD